MSFTRGHRRRPTSIATDEILKRNTYVAPNGQVLPSAMSKVGSPKKRQTHGSTSQVRFSLPAEEVSESSLNSARNSITSSNYEEDDTDGRGVFSFKPIDMEPPICFDGSEEHKVYSHKATISTASIGDSIRDVIRSNCDRNKMFIRGNTEFNKLPVPIPIEIMLPPKLSTNNGLDPNPNRLIFNGLGYEPLEKDPFRIPILLDVRNGEALPLQAHSDIKSPKIPQNIGFEQAPQLLSNNGDKLVNKPLPIPTANIENALETPVKKHTQESTEPLREILIPDLNSPMTQKLVPTKPSDFALDNEKEIHNPSPAAKRQDNQLNKRFSFPQRQYIDKENTVDEDSGNRRELSFGGKMKGTGNGLLIFSSAENSSQASCSRVPSLSSSTYSSIPSTRISSTATREAHARAKSTTSLSSSLYSTQSKQSKIHKHKRSRSQINFTIPEDINSSEAYNTGATTFFEQSSTKALPPAHYSHSKAETDNLGFHSSPATLSQTANNSSVPRIISELPLAQTSYGEIKQRNSIEPETEREPEQKDSGKEIVNENMDNEDEHSLDEVLNLGKLIISAQKNHSCTSPKGNKETLVMGKGASEKSVIDTSSHLHEIMKPFETLPEIQSLSENGGTKVSINTRYSTPLSIRQDYSVHQDRDCDELEEIRNILLNNLHRSAKESYSSPLLSQSSHESEISEPFSTISSTNTALTAVSVDDLDRVVDLTQENDDYSESKNEPLDLKFKSFKQKMPDGKTHDVIILDDEEDYPIERVSRNHGHSRSKSALTNSEFEKSSKIKSRQDNHDDPENELHNKSKTRRPNSYVLPLCDESMKSSKEILDQLKRQRTILYHQHAKLLKDTRKKESQLNSINDLQQKITSHKPPQKKTAMLKPCTISYSAPHYIDLDEYESPQSEEIIYIS